MTEQEQEQEERRKFNEELNRLCRQDPVFLLQMMKIRNQIRKNKQTRITEEQFKETMRHQRKALERIKKIKNN